MGKVIKLYEVHVEWAYFAHETGTRLSASPWGGNSRYYEGFDQEAGQVLELDDGVTVYRHEGVWYATRPARETERGWYRGAGEVTLLLDDVVRSPQGWGRVRSVRPGEEVLDLKEEEAYAG